MKFAFSADWHLSRYGQDKVEDTTDLPYRLHGIKTAMYGMADHCRKNKIDQIFIGGDLLHGKSIIYAIAQNILLDFFRDHPDIIFFVIDGNHDLAGKGVGAASALKSLDNEPNVERVQGLSMKMEDALLVPYSYKMVEHIKKSESPLLVSHFGMDEGVLNSGISIVSDISLKDLRGRYEQVFLGHYHKPQEISEEGLEVYYVGSLIQLDWGEKHDEKRFLVVDTDTRKVESVLTTGYRKYFEFEITPENRDTVVPQARKLIKEGHQVSFKKIQEVDTDDLAKEFRLVDRVDKDITNRGISSSMSLGDKLEKYLDIRGIKGDKKRKLYLDVAKEVISACSENQQVG